MFEAGEYYGGLCVDYGNVGPIMSVDGSRVSPGAGTYNQPVKYACQKNYIVMLSDGLPTRHSGMPLSRH